MKKRSTLAILLAMLLTVMMIVSMLPIGAVGSATEEEEEGTEESATGSAEEETLTVPETGNPQLDETVPVGNPGEGYTPEGTGITTAEQFANMDPDGSYYLAADITVAETYERFAGVFDGNGHTVTVSVPLFRDPQQATIKNLIVEGSVESTNGDNTAPVASGTSYACMFFNILNRADVTLPANASGNGYRGSGIAGRVGGYTTIERCTNEGAIAGYQFASGIVSLVSADSSTDGIFIDCVNYGAADSSDISAGIVAGADARVAFYRCVNYGGIFGVNTAGGILGQASSLSSLATVQHCANYGTITGGWMAGGGIGKSFVELSVKYFINGTAAENDIAETGTIIGGKYGDKDQKANAGGVVARTYYCKVTLEHCVNNATINGGNQNGGIAGWLQTDEPTTLKYCINNGFVCSRFNYAGGIIARVDEEAYMPDTEVVFFENCLNTGRVESYISQAGGIIAYTRAPITFTDCANTGTITYRANTPVLNVDNGTDAVGVTCGGILGNCEINQTFIRCRNEGAIIAKSATSTTTKDGKTTTTENTNIGIAGGIAGRCGGLDGQNVTRYLYCVNTGSVTSGVHAVNNTNHYANYAGGIAGYQYGYGARSYVEMRYCLNTGDVCGDMQAAYGVGYLNTASGVFTNNVFTGNITCNTWPSGKDKNGTATVIALAWDQGNTLDPNCYSGNYITENFSGVLVNNTAGTGSGNPVSMEGYAYVLREEDDPVTVWQGLIDASEPTEIRTAEDFANMDPCGSAILMEDITLSAAYAKSFYGSFNGNHHTITISNAAVFTFTATGCQIFDLTVAGTLNTTVATGAVAKTGGGYLTRVVNQANVTCSTAGIAVGGFMATSNVSLAHFTDCVNEGNITATGASDAGGFIAYSNDRSLFVNCENKGNITTGTNHVGGIIGECQILGTTLIGCKNSGTITMNSTPDKDSKGAGGILGYNGTAVVYLTDCVNTGNVNTEKYAGGIIGDSAKGFLITNCGNTGTIKGDFAAGGIANRHSDSGALSVTFTGCWNTGTITKLTEGKNPYVGGIAGLLGTLDAANGVSNILTDCVNTGRIIGAAQAAGGIAGDIQISRCVHTFTRCVNTGEVSGTGVAAGIVAHIAGAESNSAGNSFTSCVNTGKITGGNHTAGIAGGLYQTSIAGKGDHLFTYCVNLGEIVCAAEGQYYVGLLIGYAYTGPAYTARVKYCIAAGKVSSSDSTSATGGIAGYLNSNIVEVKNTIIAGSITAAEGVATCTYYATNDSALSTNISGNRIIAGFAAYDGAQKRGTSGQIGFGTLGSDNTVVDSLGIDLSKPTKEIFLYAGISDFSGLLGETLFPEETNENRVAVLNENGETVDVVSKLEDAGAILQNGYTVKLLADYYGGQSETIFSRNVTWTLDCNGYSLNYSDFSDYGLYLGGDGAVITVKDLRLYSMGSGIATCNSASMNATITFENAKIFAGTRRNDTDYYDTTRARTALWVNGAKSSVILTGSETEVKNAGNNNADIMVDHAALTIENGSFDNMNGRLIQIGNSTYAQPVTIYNGSFTATGSSNAHLFLLYNITAEAARPISIYNGTFTAVSKFNCIIFGFGYTKTNADFSIYGGTFTNVDSGNLFTGFAATANSNLNGTALEGSNGILRTYGGTFNKSGISRLVKYYGNQSWYFYGGTFTSTADDIIAFDINAGDTSYIPVSHVVYGAPEGVEAEPLVVTSSQSLFMMDSNATRGNFTVDIYSGTMTAGATDATIRTRGNSVVNIYGGTIDQQDIGVLLMLNDHSDLNVYGGTLQCTCTPNGQNYKVNVICLESGYTGKTLIADGTLSSTNMVIYANNIITEGSLEITGGSLTASTVCYLQNQANLDISVTGGTLTSTSGNVFHICEVRKISQNADIDEGSASQFTFGGTAKLIAAASAVYVGADRPYFFTFNGGEIVSSNKGLQIKNHGRLIINDVTITSTYSTFLLYNLADVEINGGTFTSTAGYVMQTTSEVKIKNGDNEVLFTNYASYPTDEELVRRCYAPETVVINGGSFIASTADACITLEGTYHVNTQLTINGGYFENKGMCVLRTLAGKTKNESDADNAIVVENGARATVNGGLFVLASGTSNQSHHAVVRSGGGSTYGTVVINGGTFVDQKAGSKQVIFGNNTCSTLIVNGGKLLANANQIYFVNMRSDMDNTSVNKTYYVEETYGDSTYYLWTRFAPADETVQIDTLDGAEVRMTTGSTGLRFVSYIDAAMIEAAQALADEGTEIAYGTVISPLDFVIKAGRFTMEALDQAEALAGTEVRYLNIPAENGINSDENGTEIRAAIVNIKEKNLDRMFAAIAYVQVTIDGEATYFYGDFDTATNARAASQVATAALADVSPVMTDSYIYELEDGTFSKYSVGQRAVLNSFLTKSEE